MCLTHICDPETINVEGLPIIQRLKELAKTVSGGETTVKVFVKSRIMSIIYLM